MWRQTLSFQKTSRKPGVNSLHYDYQQVLKTFETVAKQAGNVKFMLSYGKYFSLLDPLYLVESRQLYFQKWVVLQPDNVPINWGNFSLPLTSIFPLPSLHSPTITSWFSQAACLVTHSNNCVIPHFVLHVTKLPLFVPLNKSSAVLISWMTILTCCYFINLNVKS